MAGSGGSTNTLSKAVLTLDPYTCLPKRNRKYASECKEVYLANQGAEQTSESFEHFKSLEVIWFSGNRLTRIDNLETNFRIQEVYVENNSLVSLNGLRNFKFLRVLLASKNQLRNLDKQIALLAKFAFMKKLDLFDNPVAEEPDYRLRLIYHVPQVEILDKHAVKGEERVRADQVVPNLDKVSLAKAEKPKRKSVSHSAMEKTCFLEAKQIRDRWKREADNTVGETFMTGHDLSHPPPEARSIRENRDRWQSMRREDDETRRSISKTTTSLSKTLPASESGKTLLPGGLDTLASLGNSIVRQQMTATGYPLALGLHKKPTKARADYFTQQMLRPKREVDESTGTWTTRVGHEHHHTLLCS